MVFLRKMHLPENYIKAREKKSLLSSCIVGILDLYSEKQMNRHLLISIGLVTFKKKNVLLAIIAL